MARKQTSERRVGPAGNADFIEFGSERHMHFLGLRKAEEYDTITFKGYTLVDMTACGPQATEAYLREVLRQKVSTLETKPEPPQSDDPLEPNYAPPMFVPPVKPADGMTF